MLTPIRCTPNRNILMERPHNVTADAEQGVMAKQVVHLRARAEAGTDLRYFWEFGDGTSQYDSRETSHVYENPSDNPDTPAVESYTVKVTVSNGLFEDEVSDTVDVVVGDEAGVIDLLDQELPPYGCRIDAPGTLVLDLRSLNKHGLSGNFKLADLEFGPGASWPGPGSALLKITDTALEGPDYSELRYSIVAGNPVYAPAPLRGLLDIQPCAETQAADDPDTGTKPVSFWKDWKGMLWTRAAGDMSIQYFYPLQNGFYLTDAYASDHGLVAPDNPNVVLTEAERVGKCVPWLDELPENAYPPGTEPIDYVDSIGEKRADMVYPVGYVSSWPALPALLNVGETVYERAKGGVSAIASQVAVARIYDDLTGGTWNNDTGAVEIKGKGLDTYLAQLIDPVDEVSVALDVTVNDTPGLPTGIKAERLLYGGGLAIVGTTADPNLDLPFALRSRVLYREDGSLVFRGYYDGTSAAYIKGDPLLLLNVMSESDMYRLQSLCDDGSTDCATWDAAIEELYWGSLNPRELDLCRNSQGATYEGDPDPAKVQASWDATNAAMNWCKRDDTGQVTFWRDGEPDHAYLIGVQDGDDNGIPEPFEGLGKGKALTAGNAAGTGYLTLAYNNDSSLGGLPVSLQVIKVECAKNAENEESPYRGNLLVIQSDNLFDEKLTLRHTGDFGGRPDNFEFEWWIAAVDDTGVSPTDLPPSYPWQKWTAPEKGATKLGPQITIEGANPTTLRDNWLLVRYKNKNCPVCGNQYRYSALAGDPSAKPTEVRAQLAEGWIKRVVGALNPFDARVDDFVGSQTSTSVDMIRQAGPRYEGPIAMNADPENLNKVGLIEAYQTVLDRGRTLSIDAGVNDQGANAALLNVTSRIAQLYMLLGNDAYMDALDPIVGFDQSELSLRAPAIYAFANQFRADQFGLIDEELALLRGRDETLGGVAAGPTYNRLTWNFTNGEGEVAYVTNYNLPDVNLNGFIDEADAAILYPQGHGDAYGQQLTALSLYYQLLKHPNYTWIPRAEPVAVAGAPVVVDYYDERRFAAAAAARARMGAEIVNLTYRKNYAEPEVQPYKDDYVDGSDRCDIALAPGCNKRAWGVADWAGRAGEGAYFDWLVVNAMLPPVDDRYPDLRKIDRRTVEDIGAIAGQLEAIQTQLDRADQAVNPLGLTGDAVLFDLDPALTKTTPTTQGQTHFEQVYDKTITAMANTLKMFEYANQAKAAQRAGADEQYDFAANVVDEDRGLINELIEIFGYPYDADIGVNGTYPEGYDGPDIYNYDLIERTELTDPKTRCTQEQIDTNKCPGEVTSYVIEFTPMDCLGFFVEALPEGSVAAETLCPNGGINGVEPMTPTLQITKTMGLGLDSAYGRYLPSSWPEAPLRKSLGDVQMKLWGVYDTRNEYEQSLVAYENHTRAVEELATAIKDRYEVLERKGEILKTKRTVLDSLDSGIITANEIIRVLTNVGDGISSTFKTSSECLPKNVGLAFDAFSSPRCVIIAAGEVSAFVLKSIALHSGVAVDLMGFAKTVTEREFEIDLFELE
ncbi:MAG: PKD domain-containing protein, partial [Actinomycetes bacterium]